MYQQEEPMATPQMALQLYTVRTETARDMLGTLRRLAGFGYRAVELAGYGNANPATIRAGLDELGMGALGAHVQLPALQTRPAEVFAEMRALGCEYVVVPSSPEEYRGSVAGAERLAGVLDDLGAQCRTAGFHFGYHNHAHEFADVAGQSMWERLVAATDPTLVGFELDVFWAAAAGADPVALIGQHGARLPLLHLKDKPVGSDRPDAPIGAGTLPWPAILAAGAAAGVRWYIVEQDHPQDALREVAQSLQYLAPLLGGAGGPADTGA